MQVSMVCGRWREILLSNSSFWSALHIVFDSWEGRFSSLERLVQIFASRSGARALNLQLDFRDIDDGMETEISPIVGTLVCNSARWRSLSLTSIPQSSGLLSQFGDGVVFPELHNLCISGDEPLPPALYILFRDSPSLRRLELGSDLVFVDESHFDLPWHQIEDLVIADSYGPAALALLSLFPRLKGLKMFRAGGGIVGYSGHYHSNTINTMTLTGDSQEDVDTTLQHLTLPDLASLTMCRTDESEHQWKVWAESSLTDFLSRSTCTITSLHLKRLPMTDSQALSLLGLTPALANLEIEDSRTGANHIVTGTFLQRLAVNPQTALLSAKPLLPLLTKLTLAVRKDSSIEQDIFDVVSSRWIPDREQATEVGVESLRSVCLTIVGRDADRNKLSFLECFRDAGLQMEVVYQPRFLSCNQTP
ncbi:hypothetical protein V5O48_011918 [Marasmius crinis-equi]|uniref:F-box domain-containing protein n=1 Tax=Marasmius crinis-equi TaxID=585013 RepID=A0ABR3F478_9AGAR